jgi:hypothetical protein
MTPRGSLLVSWEDGAVASHRPVLVAPVVAVPENSKPLHVDVVVDNDRVTDHSELIRSEIDALRRLVENDRKIVFALTSALFILLSMQITIQVRIDNILGRRA